MGCSPQTVRPARISASLHSRWKPRAAPRDCQGGKTCQDVSRRTATRRLVVATGSAAKE
jgi:hypothetical protein